MALAALTCCTAPFQSALADDFSAVGVSLVRPDWQAASSALRAGLDNNPAIRDALTFTARAPRGRRTKPPLARRYPAFAQLSAATDRHFRASDVRRCRFSCLSIPPPTSPTG